MLFSNRVALKGKNIYFGIAFHYQNENLHNCVLTSNHSLKKLKETTFHLVKKRYKKYTEKAIGRIHL